MKGVIRKQKRIKPDMIFMAAEYIIVVYVAAATIINILNIADIMHFYTWFMNPAFFGSSLLIFALLQYCLIRVNKKEEALVKIRPYIMGIMAADIISVCNLPLCLMLFFLAGYFLISGFNRKYDAREASFTVLAACLGMEIYNIAMLSWGGTADNCVSIFLTSATPDVLLTAAAALYGIVTYGSRKAEVYAVDTEQGYYAEPYNNEVEADNEWQGDFETDVEADGEEFVSDGTRIRKFQKWLTWIQENSQRIACCAGVVVCVLSLGLYLYFIVMTGIGNQKISGSTEEVYILEHCDDRSLALTVMQDENAETYSVSFEKYTGMNNQKVYLRYTAGGRYQIVFLDPECVLEVDEDMALCTATMADSSDQSWLREGPEGERQLNRFYFTYNVPLCYSALSQDGKMPDLSVGNRGGDYEFFAVERTVSDEFITRLVTKYGDEFVPAIVMGFINGRLGAWINLLFVLAVVVFMAIIYMRRLIGDKPAAVYAILFVYTLAYGAIGAIALFLAAFAMQCYSSYYISLQKNQRLKKEEFALNMSSRIKLAMYTLSGAITVIILLFIVVEVHVAPFSSANAAEDEIWEGLGSKEQPFLISSLSDLALLRDRVNSGMTYEGYYFLQICDIDLGEENLWVPIGKFGSGHYFYGTYDGGSNKIKNLYIKPDEGNSVNNVGLFGQLGGQVLNLGIESGRIEGDCVGSIASHSVGDRAAIINCYNKATVIGTGRAGGICDNFTGGSVVNCVNFGDVSGGVSAQIVSYNAISVMNVFPVDNAVTDYFHGTFRNYIELTEENIYDSLNKGIQYLYRENMVPSAELRYWGN